MPQPDLIQINLIQSDYLNRHLVSLDNPSKVAQRSALNTWSYDYGTTSMKSEWDTIHTFNSTENCFNPKSLQSNFNQTLNQSDKIPRLRRVDTMRTEKLTQRLTSRRAADYKRYSKHISGPIRSEKIKKAGYSNLRKSNRSQSNPIKFNEIQSDSIKFNQIQSNSNQIKSIPIESNSIESNEYKFNKMESNQI